MNEIAFGGAAFSVPGKSNLCLVLKAKLYAERMRKRSKSRLKNSKNINYTGHIVNYCGRGHSFSRTLAKQQLVTRFAREVELAFPAQIFRCLQSLSIRKLKGNLRLHCRKNDHVSGIWSIARSGSLNRIGIYLL
jgi:hypothetical protein